MPHDHSDGAHGGTGLNLLPPWALVIWVLVTAAITATHAVHLLGVHPGMSGQTRAWHCAHLLMGAGMLYMFAPWSGTPGSPRAWQYAFSLAAIVAGGWVAWSVQRGDAVNTMWIPAAIGLAAMGYMFGVHRGHGTPAVTYALVAYVLVEAAGWSRGWFAESGPRRASVVPFAIGSGRSGVRAAPLAGPARWDVNASQTAMSVAMGYMFLAMDAGAAGFFDAAFAAGAVTEQSLWACSLIALTVLACTPARAPGGAVARAPERAHTRV